MNRTNKQYASQVEKCLRYVNDELKKIKFCKKKEYSEKKELILSTASNVYQIPIENIKIILSGSATFPENL